MSTEDVSYTNSVYNNLKSYIVALQTRIILNYGAVEAGISMGSIISDPYSNTLLDRIVTGNAYQSTPSSYSYPGRTTNKYPGVTAPNGSSATLITFEGGTSYNIYSMIKNSSGQWEYYGITSTNKEVMPFN
jgi:hypothetical protein